MTNLIITSNKINFNNAALGIFSFIDIYLG